MAIVRQVSRDNMPLVKLSGPPEAVLEIKVGPDRRRHGAQKGIRPLQVFIDTAPLSERGDGCACLSWRQWPCIKMSVRLEGSSSRVLSSPGRNTSTSDGIAPR